jgi:hypothetical protein
VCADHYQIHVSTGPHLEGEGWINLGLAIGSQGTWAFIYDAISRSVDMMPMQMRNGFSILCPGQVLTEEWKDFGDQRFMLASWSWANTFIHVILADDSTTAATHLYAPRINTFVGFDVAPNTAIDIGNLMKEGGIAIPVQLCYSNPYIKIKKLGTETTNAFGIIHYCGGPCLTTP